MNNVQLTGNLTRNPETKYSQGENPKPFCRFTLAVNRRFRRDGEQTADFINCVAFGPLAEHIQKYYVQGSKMVVSNGRIQTGSYTNKDGVKVYTTDVVVEEVEFGGSKDENRQAAAEPQAAPAKQAEAPASESDFMPPFDDDDLDLPFN